MIQDAVIRLLSEQVGPSRVYLNEPMSKHTTFRIGGPADVLVEPSDVMQVETVCRTLRQLEIPFLVLGNGSNVLVGDLGIRGVVVKLGNAFSTCRMEEDTLLSAQAGIKLSRLAAHALDKSLTGLEFAAGIPGTLGGALYMNAGAYGGEMSQVVEEVSYLNEEGKVATIRGCNCGFGYRTSIFAQNPDYVILGCTIRLKEGNPEEIKATMDDLAERRIDKQPLNFPSAGSTFKRPEGAFAGKLIQDAGLMGLRVGGASVSEKHAGFVVNDKKATAKDVRELIALVQEKVKENSGFDLEPEVRMIGEF